VLAWIGMKIVSVDHWFLDSVDPRCYFGAVAWPVMYWCAVKQAMISQPANPVENSESHSGGISKSAGYPAKYFTAASLEDLLQSIDNCKIIDFTNGTHFCTVLSYSYCRCNSRSCIVSQTVRFLNGISAYVHPSEWVLICWTFLVFDGWRLMEIFIHSLRRSRHCWDIVVFCSLELYLSRSLSD